MRSLAILIVATFLWGCAASTSKDYVEPEDPAIQACISDCRATRTQCNAQFNDQYRRCQSQKDYEERVYQDCVRRGGTFCIKPESCSPFSGRVCVDRFDACYQACGGIIKTGGS